MVSARGIGAFLFVAVSSAAAQVPSPPEGAILKLLNRLRDNPGAFAPTLRDQRRYYHGNLFTLPGQVSIETQEGVRALDQAILDLEAPRRPLTSLAFSPGLARSASAHARDTGSRGITGHQGSDGSNLAQRVSRFGTWSRSIGEAISYGDADPNAVISQLLIDDGVPERGHRRSLLDPQWRFIGIACGPHSTWRYTCVLDFAVEFLEK